MRNAILLPTHSDVGHDIAACHPALWHKKQSSPLEPFFIGCATTVIGSPSLYVIRLQPSSNMMLTLKARWSTFRQWMDCVSHAQRLLRCDCAGFPPIFLHDALVCNILPHVEHHPRMVSQGSRNCNERDSKKTLKLKIVRFGFMSGTIHRSNSSSYPFSDAYLKRHQTPI